LFLGDNILLKIDIHKCILCYIENKQRLSYDALLSLINFCILGLNPNSATKTESNSLVEVPPWTRRVVSSILTFRIGLIAKTKHPSECLGLLSESGSFNAASSLILVWFPQVVMETNIGVHAALTQRQSASLPTKKSVISKFPSRLILISLMVKRHSVKMKDFSSSLKLGVWVIRSVGEHTAFNRTFLSSNLR
jgi:hypothetical protein